MKPSIITTNIYAIKSYKKINLLWEPSKLIITHLKLHTCGSLSPVPEKQDFHYQLIEEKTKKEVNWKISW
jgi:hypothetical protein